MDRASTKDRLYNTVAHSIAIIQGAALEDCWSIKEQFGNILQGFWYVFEKSKVFSWVGGEAFLRTADHIKKHDLPSLIAFRRSDLTPSWTTRWAGGAGFFNTTGDMIDLGGEEDSVFRGELGLLWKN